MICIRFVVEVYLIDMVLIMIVISMMKGHGNRGLLLLVGPHCFPMSRKDCRILLGVRHGA